MKPAAPLARNARVLQCLQWSEAPSVSQWEAICEEALLLAAKGHGAIADNGEG